MTENAPALSGKKILVTGPTGQVALPLTLSLAKENEVWGVARFKDAEARAGLEAAGVRCHTANLVEGDFGDLPSDFTHVLNFAVVKSGKWDRDIDANVVATGLLMRHCRAAETFFHCSSTAVYASAGREPRTETDPLGDNHKVIFPTYSITKIAAETMVRFGARAYGIPATIARLNVPYGENGGWPAFHLEMLLAGTPVPVHADSPSVYNPIHDDDILASLPSLLAAATVPATIVNWAGQQQVSVEEWCTELARLVGVEATFASSEQSLESVVCDLTRFHEIAGPSSVDWKDGMRRLVTRRHPERLLG